MQQIQVPSEETLTEPTEAPFPAALLLALIASAAIVGVGLLAYFKKRK